MDVGTGFYVEKTPSAAQEFYKRKVEELGRNLAELEKILQGKQGNLGVVEDGEWLPQGRCTFGDMKERAAAAMDSGVVQKLIYRQRYGRK